jgi:UDP-N-acetylglucosamine diphosphorylase / glucose-1-phosphate thymidylyltransferase / UDP-N-acetylgalactosamine diphosphorylase / glucosamine-1-phosphate N-acetyltransferase / galactosamine-1-phosphate N-acetyltransferase
LQTPILIILAGGASSRMWPLREKSLLRFGTEPLLFVQLRRYQALGFREVVIVANPENRTDITSLASQIPHEQMAIRVVVQTEPKGMGDALLAAEPALPSRPNLPIYVTQVHDVVDETLHTDMLKAWRADPTATYIAGYEREDYFPGGYLIVSPSGRITGMIEKPGADKRPSNLVNIVAHIHADAGRLMRSLRTEYHSDTTSDDHYERTMDTLMKDSVYRVVPYRGAWNALKYPWHVLDVMNYYLSKIQGQHIAESAVIAPTATLAGDVYIGERARVFPGAAIVGPAYIGSDTIIGNNALVRASMVLNGCNVGFTTEVARSYVAEHCDMHACRVLDSVFAPNVNFSAGCTTANLRIDHGSVSSRVKGQKMDTARSKLGAIIGQGAFLAVDVMTMPGVKVGEGAQVGPGTHVHQDISDGQRVYIKQELHIVDPKED